MVTICLNCLNLSDIWPKIKIAGHIRECIISLSHFLKACQYCIDIPHMELKDLAKYCPENIFFAINLIKAHKLTFAQHKYKEESEKWLCYQIKWDRNRQKSGSGKIRWLPSCILLHYMQILEIWSSFHSFYSTNVAIWISHLSNLFISWSNL